MSEIRFIKFIPSAEALYLAKKHHNAFILLMFIAERARRENGHPDGLLIGECHIGDYKKYGLTEKEYRTAKKILVERKHIEIIETCRTRKSEKNSKSTLNLQNSEKSATERATKTTTVGTLVKLISSTVYDINPEPSNQQKGDRKGDRGATEGRPKGDEQECKEDISIDISNKEDAQSAARLRSRKDLLSFNFETWSFEGISPEDLKAWSAMYPQISIELELTKAVQWLKANPTRSDKKLWRKFLTGWFGRANDSAENKKAFRSSGQGNAPDRRTRNKDGTPITTRAEDLF